jgi:protein PhnA
MTQDDDDNEDLIVRDSNGTQLKAGDSIQAIKDLKVRGTSTVIKRGTVIRNIRLTDDADLVEGHADKMKNLYLQVQFFKKV